MRPFWNGFEKRAASPIGKMRGVRSGIRTNPGKTVIEPEQLAKSNVSTAARHEAPKIPTPSQRAMTHMQTSQGVKPL
jgi:hypothetical protein